MTESYRPVDWIEEIVLRHENRLYRIAAATLGNKTEAEDILQEVFLKVLEKRPVFESHEHEKAWLIRVTINQCRSRLSSTWWRKTESLLVSCPAKMPEQEQLMDSVLELPAKYRTVIHLFYYEGYSTKEIAGITQQKESTVRSLLSRARKKLQSILKEEA